MHPADFPDSVPPTSAVDSSRASDAPLGPPHFEFNPVATRALASALRLDPFPKLVAACAPPGYGKTVMLGRLHDEFLARGETCLWVSLDDGDTDLSSLVYRIRSAMDHAGIAVSLESSGSSERFPDRGALADAVLKPLSVLRGATTLFIDNLGYCQDSALGLLLERLVFSTGADLRLVLSSTRDIPVDIVRAKLEVGALELRAAELSFDRISTANLLQQAGISTTGGDDLDRIVAHTEGWPAAVRLLQVLMAGQVDGTVSTAAGGRALDIDHVLQRFSGDHGDIARVLTRRVLVGFDPALVQFMVEIALVREFSADLAAAMTGRAEARGWIDLLVARNVLIFPLDRNRRWLRFHTLLREFLLAEGQESIEPTRRRAVLNRAARWHVDHGDNVAAISIAIEAGETALAQQLLDRIARVVVGDHGRMTTLVHWVDRLLAADVMPLPETHAWFVWALCDSHQYERARKALDDFDRRVATDLSFAEIDGGAQQRLLFLRMLVNLWIDRLDSAHEQAEAWLAQEPAADALTMATVTSIACIAEIDASPLSDAQARVERARAFIERSDSAYGVAWVGILRACIEIGMARPDTADAVLTETRERVVRVIGDDASVVVTLDFVHARALLDQGRLEPARARAQRGLQRAMHHGIMFSLEQGLIASTAFWNPEAPGGVSGELLERVANSYPVRGQLLLAAAQVRRLIQIGRPGDAQLLAERCGLNAERHRLGGSLPMRERGDWMLAPIELLIARGDCDGALAQIERLMKVARAHDRNRDRIELLILAMDAHRRLGKQRMAVRHLSMAVALATPGNAVHPFMVRHAAVAQLLAETDEKDFGLTRPAEWSFLERLRLGHEEAAPAPALPDDAAVTSTGVPTLREIQLLDLLDQGLNNEQVADRLSLSVSTVKWHLHNVYAKLGVRSRSAALARARRLNLIGR